MNTSLNKLITETIAEVERINSAYDAHALEDDDDMIIFGIRIALAVFQESVQYYETEEKTLAEELINKANAFIEKWEDENQ